MRKFTKDQKEYLDCLHKSCYRSHNKASKLFNERYNPNFPLTPQEIIQYWESEDLSIIRTGGRTHGLSLEKFRILHEKHDGEIKKMVEESRSGANNLIKKCQKLGLPYKTEPKTKTKSKIDFGATRFKYARVVNSKRKGPSY